MNRTWMGIVAAALGLATLSASPGRADELKVGDPAPPFTLQGSDGKTYSLDQFKGKQGVVIAWYPKAFTGGCTLECKSFREKSAEMKKLDVAYFTASVDAPEYNKKFAESLDVDYPILSDPDKKVAEAYGVLNKERGLALRWTFYIDKSGTVRAIDKSVIASKAASDVIDKVKELKLSGD